METEYLKSWRMALGGYAADGTCVTLTVEEQRLDSSLKAVYDSTAGADSDHRPQR